MKSKFRHHVGQVFCPLFFLVFTAFFLCTTSAAAQGCAITCPANQTLPANAMCQATLPSYISNPSLFLSGNCFAFAPAQSPAPGTIISGPTTVFLTATNSNLGSQISCFFVVTLSDETAPTITCPTNITQGTQSNFPGQCSAYVNFPNATATENCSPGAFVSQISGLPSGSPFPVGTTTVVFRAVDIANNSSTCSLNITVTDQTPPDLVCPANVTLNSNPDECGTGLAYLTPSCFDNCTLLPTVTQISGPQQHSFLAAGTLSTIVLQATDEANNSKTCSFTVSVVDNQKPVITCPPYKEVVIGSACSANVTFPSATATDNCTASPTITQVQGPASGDAFPVAGLLIGGGTLVRFRATDASGNTNECYFVVRVKESERPVITCPSNITQGNTPGQCGANVTYPNATATDNCTLSGVGYFEGPVSGSFFSLGSSIVKFSAMDVSGNSTTCTMTVTVTDTEAPVITCPANITLTNTTDQCGGANVTFNSATATDNCSASPTIVNLGPASGSFFDAGTTSVTFRATDAANNAATCSFNVTVKDTQPPAIICPSSVTVNNNPAEACSAVVNYGAPAATDNCQVKSFALISGMLSYSTFPVGSTTIIWSATDMSGNSATCYLTVLVKDITPPAITCPANIVQANTTGQCGSNVTFNSATASDNCTASPAITNLGTASGSFFAVGTTSVTFRAMDEANNSATCSFTVTVNDTQVPAISCPANIVQNNTTGQCGTNVTFNSATASDNCTASPAIANLGTASGSFFTVGTTAVTFRATDTANNTATCSFTVTVNDTQVPVISCPANITVNNNPADACSAVIQYSTPAASDNCGVGSITLTGGLSGGATFPVGITTNTWRVTDVHGNSASCSFTVQVKDVTPPAITCPANQTISASSSCTGTLGSWAPLSLTDNCNPAPSFVQSPAASTVLSGHNDSKLVSLVALDANFNKALCTFTVTLKDVTAPVARCKNATLNLETNGSVTVAPSSVNNGSTDNCSFTTTLTPNTFGCAHVGNQIVTLRATDAGGNSSTCTAIVTIKDLTAPTASCKTINVYLNQTGHAGITPASVNNSSYDACGITSMTINKNEFDCGQINGSPVLVQLSLRDVNNNQSSCQAQVYVKDNIPPTAVCTNTTVWLSASGYASVQTAPLADNSFDNCSVTSYSPVAKAYNTSNLGVNNLTITVKDWSNNSATCVSQVTVLPYTPGKGTADPRADEGFVYDAEMSFDLGLAVFPNPTSGESTIKFHLPEVQACHLRLFDLNGRLVINQDFQGAAGDNYFGLDLNDVAPGMYLIEVGAAGMREQKKLVLQR